MKNARCLQKTMMAGQFLRGSRRIFAAPKYKIIRELYRYMCHEGIYMPAHEIGLCWLAPSKIFTPIYING